MKNHRIVPTSTWVVCVCLLVTAAPARALDVAVPYVHADTFWGHGYLGSGVSDELEIGVIDAYLAESTHPAISGNWMGSIKFSKGGGSTFKSDHATAVTGAAVSQDATYKGMAPQAGWWTGQTTNPASMSTQETQGVAAETFGRGLDDLGGNPVEVITLSIGLPGNSMGTEHWSKALDHVVNENGRTVTVAAGNYGPNPGSLNNYPTGAYNAIIVGATGDTAGNPSEDYSNVWNGSSRGPTTDGRCKPDIVAPGAVIRIPILLSNGGWADGTGTSLATPMVAGGAALLIDMGQNLGYSTDPKVVKSVLLNSADKLGGWTHTSTQPLDYNQGAGQMNLHSAYRQYLFGEREAGTVAGIGWDRQELDYNDENLYTMDIELPAGAVITATLAWDRIVTATDPDPPKLKDIEYTVDHLDDLNLYLYKADDLNTPLASSVSTIDNVEHIYYSVTYPGQYVVGVEMFGAGPGDFETYGLSWRVTPGAGLDIPGDANLDGAVNVGDLGILGANYGLSDKTWFQADFNGDGLVDVGDLGILGANYGSGAGAAPIPEPAALSLLVLGGAWLLKRKPSRSARVARG